MTDAELVALLLAEARLRGPALEADEAAYDDERDSTDYEQLLYDSWQEARAALDAAVLGRLEAERGRA